MTTRIRHSAARVVSIWCATALVILVLVGTAGAQDGPKAGASGGAAALLPQEGKPKVFIVYLADFERMLYRPERAASTIAYNEFYAAIRKLGQYEVVDDPAKADLLMELIYTPPDSCAGGFPFIGLLILDRASGARRGYYQLALLTRGFTYEEDFANTVNELALKTVREPVPAGRQLADRRQRFVEPPLPPRIALKNVYLEMKIDNITTVSISADELYQQLHANLEKWGRYTLVASPEEADMVARLRIVIGANNAKCEDKNVDNRQVYVDMVLMTPNGGSVFYGLMQELYGAYFPHHKLKDIKVSEKNARHTAEQLVKQLRRLTDRADKESARAQKAPAEKRSLF